MRVLIGILCCARDRQYESLVRSTWLSGQLVDYRFFLGRTPGAPAADEVFLDAPDQFVMRGTIDKMKQMLIYAIANGYDYLFKCDVDTYVHVPRLLSSGFEQYDWSGYGEPYGGTGYWLSRKAIEWVVANETRIPTPQAEDSWIADNLKRAGFVAHQDPRYHSLTSEGPKAGNDIITAHWYMENGERIIYFKERLSLFQKYHTEAR